MRFNACAAVSQCLLYPALTCFKILWIDFDSDTVPSPEPCRDCRRSRSREWVEYRVTDKAKHANKPLCQFEREWCGMVLRGSAGQLGPNLLKPNLVAIGWNNTQNPGRNGRTPISSLLPFHENEFHVVLNHRIGFVWFSQKPASVSLRLEFCIRNLVPDNGRQICITDILAVFLNGCMKRNDRVHAPVLSTRETDVTDDTDQSATRYKHPMAGRPHLVELGDKTAVISDMTQLIGMLPVFLQRPIRRRSDDQVDTILCKKIEVPGIGVVQLMPCGNALELPFDLPDQQGILGNPRQCGLMIR